MHDASDITAVKDRHRDEDDVSNNRPH